ADFDSDLIWVLISPCLPSSERGPASSHSEATSKINGNGGGQKYPPHPVVTCGTSRAQRPRLAAFRSALTKSRPCLQLLQVPCGGPRLPVLERWRRLPPEPLPASWPWPCVPQWNLAPRPATRFS